MQEHFLRINAVTKAYSSVVAVNNISLAIPKQSIYGLLGPNGAGKTSLIRMITTITTPDSGEILLNGEKLAEKHTQEIGYMPEERGLYKKMKVYDQLLYLMRLRGLDKRTASKRIKAWLAKFDLTEWSGKLVSELSKGMQQKVQFIATVAHEPKLLVLDEPFSGLDPVNTLVIEKEIIRLRDEGTTIIFSTHRMEQVEELCDRIALINKGKVVLEDEIRAARKKFQKNIHVLEFEGNADSLSNLTTASVELLKPGLANLALHGASNTNDLLKELAALDIEIHKFESHLPRLNDIFIEIVNSPEYA